MRKDESTPIACPKCGQEPIIEQIRGSDGYKASCGCNRTYMAASKELVICYWNHEQRKAME